MVIYENKKNRNQVLHRTFNEKIQTILPFNKKDSTKLSFSKLN